MSLATKARLEARLKALKEESALVEASNVIKRPETGNSIGMGTMIYGDVVVVKEPVIEEKEPVVEEKEPVVEEKEQYYNSATATIPDSIKKKRKVRRKKVR